MSSIEAEVRAKQPHKADFRAEKGKLKFKCRSIRKDRSWKSVLDSHCIGDIHRKTKGAKSPSGSAPELINYYIAGSKCSSPRQF